MSLLDLKREQKKHKYPPSAQGEVISVHEFIQDAVRYAQGKRQVVTGANDPFITTVEDAIVLAAEQKKKRKFKRVTFTFSECAVEQLNQSSKLVDVNKSRLIRILVNHFSRLDEEEQKVLISKDQTP